MRLLAASFVVVSAAFALALGACSSSSSASDCSDDAPSCSSSCGAITASPIDVANACSGADVTVACAATPTCEGERSCSVRVRDSVVFMFTSCEPPAVGADWRDCTTEELAAMRAAETNGTVCAGVDAGSD